MNKNQEKKAKVINELVEKAQKAKAIVFADYRGLSHKQLEGMRKSLRKIEAEISIAKNTLIKRALDQTGLPKQEKVLEQPTATFFAYGDPFAALKELYKTIKNLKLPVVKYAIFEGKEYTADEVQKLSTLPGRNQLIAQLVGQMKAPLYGLHRSLHWNIQRLVIALSEVQKKKN